MPIANRSKYGFGRENAPGTFVAPGVAMLSTKGGIPFEGFIQLDLGDMISVHQKAVGAPFDMETARLHVGKEPKAPTFEHNIHQAILGVLVASMVPYGLAASLATLRPTAGRQWEYGDTDAGNMTFSVWHEPGVATSQNMVVGGCVCSSLALTFPQGGGPVRMAWSAAGMDSDEDQSAQTAANYGYPAVATIDHLASDFRYFYGTPGSPTEFYPDADLVITFTPVLQVQRRCQDKPRLISVSRVDVTAQIKFPWDADADVHDGYDDMAAVTRRQLMITNAFDDAYDNDPDAAGEWNVSVIGHQDAAPTVDGEGIIGENVTLTGTGVSTFGTDDFPFTMQMYDATTFEDI